jgi:DNA-binding winged helix-turn-helix (wHTH) protein/tetratricopeptide (TPR) repeat protein
VEPRSEIRFDGWTLLRQSGELLKDGVRVRLQVQPQQLLEALLERPGELVTREELIARLWPKGVVEFDTALNSVVRRLRTVLGDHADAPRYIETIPRRGYRFIGTVDEAHALPSAPVEVPASLPPEAGVRAVVARPRWRVVAAALALTSVALAALVSVHLAGRAAASGTERAHAVAEAEERARRAQFFFQRRSTGDLDRAETYFREALSIDPQHARAWSGLASVYWIKTVEGELPRTSGLERVRDAAERALALDPDLAEPHLRLATLSNIEGDAAAGERHLRRAIALDPVNPLVLGFAASAAAGQGRLDEAVDLQRRAVAADPLSQVARYNLASFLYLAGRYADAQDELRRLAEVTPERPGGHMAMAAMLLVLQGQFDEAIAAAQALPDGPARLQVLALAHHGGGRAQEAEAALAGLIQATRDKEAYRVAEVYAFRGETELAFDWLGVAAEQVRSGDPFPSRSPPMAMLQSPILRPLQADPRWQARLGG